MTRPMMCASTGADEVPVHALECPAYDATKARVRAELDAMVRGVGRRAIEESVG